VDDLLGSFRWYDALCINQHDLDERSQQVTMFGRIYQSTSQVVVYLGPESPHDLQAIALLCYIHDHFSSQLNALWRSPITEWVLGVERFSMLQPLEIPQTDPFGALEVCETVADIFNGAWTERLWMAQEMILNPQTSMLRGKELVDFEVILSMPVAYLTNVVRSGFNNLLRQSTLIALWSIQTIKKRRFSEVMPMASDLGVLLHSFRIHKCSGPRDKVFAVLGLAGDAEDIKVIANYKKSIIKIYAETIAILLDEDSTLKALSHIRSPLAERNKGFPSWVCDWMETPARVSLILKGNASKSYHSESRFELNKMVLVLSGWTVGTMCTHIEDLPNSLGYLYRYANQEDSAELWDAFEEIIDRIRASYRGSFDIDRLLSRTLLADTEWPTPKSKDEGIDAKAFREAMVLVRSKMKGNPMHQAQQNVEEEQSSSNTDLAREWLYHDLTNHRSLWLTEDKLLCLAPIDTREGDIATVLLGGEFVYILRPVGDGSFQYIGDAYIHEFMDGQALDDPDAKETLREFRMV
jgi:hypothetical protein